MEKDRGITIDNRELMTQAKTGACNTAMVQDPEPAPVKEKSKDELEAEKLGVSVPKLHAMRAYARLLVQQNRGQRKPIKESTVRAKVARKFNIKLS